MPLEVLALLMLELHDTDAGSQIQVLRRNNTLPLLLSHVAALPACVMSVSLLSQRLQEGVRSLGTGVYTRL